MAGGRPPVCLDLAGPAVQVTGETGYKVSPASPEAAVSGLAEAMWQLATNQQLRERMAAAGRERVRRHFSWTSRGDALAEVYQASRLPAAQ